MVHTTLTVARGDRATFWGLELLVQLWPSSGLTAVYSESQMSPAAPSVSRDSQQVLASAPAPVGGPR